MRLGQQAQPHALCSAPALDIRAKNQGTDSVALHNDAKIDRLHASKLFARCDKKALTDLASAVDEVSVASGRTLFTQGSRHNEAYVIQSGTAEVLVDGNVVGEIPAGELIGEISLFDPGPASATVQAKTDMELLVIPHNRFAQILDQTPGLAAAIARELAVRLRNTDARLKG